MATRGVYVFDHETGRVVPKTALARRAPKARGDFPCPQIMTDAMEPGRSQLDGRVYDSKSALFRSYDEYTARTGKEVQVVGDQVHHLTRDEPERADEAAIDAAIKRSLEIHA